MEHMWNSTAEYTHMKFLEQKCMTATKKETGYN